MKRIVCLVLVFALCFCVAGCKKPIEATDLMDDIKPQPTPNYIDIDDGSLMLENQRRFSLELLEQSAEKKKGENMLISPLSVSLALAMTANGAQGKTEEEMTTVLGASTQSLNAYLKNYVYNLPSSDDYKVKLANSIWFRDDQNRLTVEKDFLQTNADYFGAQIYESPFDKTTVKDINNWVNNNTDGMIKKIVDNISSDTVMYLINALVFDAKWNDLYEKDQVEDCTFSTYSGEKRMVSMMYSSEHIFLESGNATGFKKCYKDGEYAFVAILPEKGMDIYDFIKSGEVAEILYGNEIENENKCVNVCAGIPKFSYEYELDMNSVLEEMGMPTAFDSGKADFKKMATSSRGNIYIGGVLHKTYIEVGEQGTKAAAVTKVEMNDESAMEIGDGKSVILDRPFIYMIMDNANNLPLFIGVVIDIGEAI